MTPSTGGTRVATRCSLPGVSARQGAIRPSLILVGDTVLFTKILVRAPVRHRQWRHEPEFSAAGRWLGQGLARSGSGFTGMGGEVDAVKC